MLDETDESVHIKGRGRWKKNLRNIDSTWAEAFCVFSWIQSPIVDRMSACSDQVRNNFWFVVDCCGCPGSFSIQRWGYCRCIDNDPAKYRFDFYFAIFQQLVRAHRSMWPSTRCRRERNAYNDSIQSNAPDDRIDPKSIDPMKFCLSHASRTRRAVARQNENLPENCVHRSEHSSFCWCNIHGNKHVVVQRTFDAKMNTLSHSRFRDGPILCNGIISMKIFLPFPFDDVSLTQIYSLEASRLPNFWITSTNIESFRYHRALFQWPHIQMRCDYPSQNVQNDFCWQIGYVKATGDDDTRFGIATLKQTAVATLQCQLETSQ